MASEITETAKEEGFSEYFADFFKVRQLIENNHYNNLATDLLKRDCTSKVIEDIVSNENPERKYRILDATNFYDSISRPGNTENCEFRSSFEDDVPPEIAEKIGGIFKVLYASKDYSRPARVENVLNSDARIRDLVERAQLPSKLAKVCYSYLYEAAEFALRKQARELQGQYENAVGEDMDEELVVLTYDTKPHTVRGVEKDYAYQIADNFKAYLIGENKTANEEQQRSFGAKSELLNIILNYNRNADEFVRELNGRSFTSQLSDGLKKISLPERLKPEIDNIVDKIKFEKSIIGYDAVKLPNGDKIIPVLCKPGEGYSVKVEKTWKNIALKNSSTKASVNKIITPSGKIYLDWYSGINRLVQAIADTYLENTHHFHQNW